MTQAEFNKLSPGRTILDVETDEGYQIRIQMKKKKMIGKCLLNMQKL